MQYYPPLTSIIDSSQLPDIFNTLVGDVDSLLSNIVLAQYQVQNDPRHGTTTYYVVARVQQQVSFEILGTGIYLVLNPNYSSGYTDFPLTLSVKFPILAILPYPSRL